MSVTRIPTARFLLVSFTLLVAHPVVADQAIQLQRQGGTYVVPVRINNAITLDFILDSGAADVLIPADVVLLLFRTGTIARRDFVGARTYSLADGSELASDGFILRELKVGDYLVRNVTASVGPVRGEPLLGQSFLSKLPSWTIDNERHVIVFHDRFAPAGGEQTAAVPILPPAPQQMAMPIPTKPISPLPGESRSTPLQEQDLPTAPCAAIAFRPVPSGMTDGEQKAGLYNSRHAKLELRAEVKQGEPVNYYLVANGKRLAVAPTNVLAAAQGCAAAKKMPNPATPVPPCTGERFTVLVGLITHAAAQRLALLYGFDGSNWRFCSAGAF